MARFYPALNPKHRAFIAAQKLFFTSSGTATSHLKLSPKASLMWCGFDSDPLILRVYGRGRAVRRQDAEWGGLHRHFSPLPGERQLKALDIESVQTSCGYALYRRTPIRASATRWRAGLKRKVQSGCWITGARKTSSASAA